MYHQIRKIAFSLVLLSLTGCNDDKDKWKLPTDLMFTIDINRSETMDGRLAFNSGYIHLVEFSIDGSRDQGEDIYFEKEWETPLKVEFDPETKVSALDFDIPQGSYGHLDFEIEAEKDGGTSIAVNGAYTNDDNEVVKVALQLQSAEVYKVVAEESSGNSQIILDKDQPRSVHIRFDPAHWFETVTAAMLDNAEITSIDGEDVIIVSDSGNEAIYDLVAGRIDERTKIIFE